MLGMRVLFFAVVLACLGFAIHLLVWWIAIPRRQTRGLLALFAMTPLVLVLVWVFAGDRLPALWPATPWECLHVGIFYSAVVLAYVVVYSALEERSPSMTLLSHVWEASAKGCSRTQLEAVLGRASPVEVRLAAMVRDGMVAEHQEIYQMTAKGYRWLATFEWVRKLLGFSPGG